MKDGLVIELSNLSLELINKYPTWTWYEGSLFKSENLIHPVDLTKIDFDDLDIIMFAASFVTAENKSLRGEVTYDVEADNIYSIGIFYDHVDFNFSIYFEDLYLQELERLRLHVKNDKLMVFPVEYKCDINNVIRDKSIGTFNPFG
jgi:hypothetical protein